MIFYKTIDLIMNAVSSIIGISFMKDYFGEKYKGWKEILFFCSACFIYFICVTILDSFATFEGISGIIYSLILFLYAFFALNGHWFEKALISIIWNIVLLITSFGTFCVFRLIFNQEIIDIMSNDDFVRVYIVITVAILKYIFSRLIILFRKKDILYLKKQESIAVICIFVLLYIMVIAFFSIELQTSSEENIRRHYTVILLLCGFIGIIVGTYYFFHKLSAYNKIKLQQEYLQTYIKEQEKYLNDMTKMNEEFRIFRHDIKSHFTNIHYMMKEAEFEEAIKYLEKLDGSLKHYAWVGDFTEQKGINVVLSKIVQNCYEKEIEFTYQIGGNFCGIEEMELGILLTNILNNAVEAANKVKGKRKIHLFIQNNKNYLEILLSNSVLQGSIKKNPNLETTKEDKIHHGYGLKSVKQIVEKYDGIYQYKEESGKFIQKVYLKQIRN